MIFNFCACASRPSTPNIPIRPSLLCSVIAPRIIALALAPAAAPAAACKSQELVGVCGPIGRWLASEVQPACHSCPSAHARKARTAKFTGVLTGGGGGFFRNSFRQFLSRARPRAASPPFSSGRRGHSDDSIGRASWGDRVLDAGLGGGVGGA